MSVVDDLAAGLGYEAERQAWEAIVLSSGERHVIPLDDLKPHVERPQCWCGPTDDEGVWVHHSMDRREFYENGEAKV